MEHVDATAYLLKTVLFLRLNAIDCTDYLLRCLRPVAPRSRMFAALAKILILCPGVNPSYFINIFPEYTISILMLGSPAVDSYLNEAIFETVINFVRESRRQ